MLEMTERILLCFLIINICICKKTLGYEKKGMTADDKMLPNLLPRGYRQEILDLHNEMRRKVTPTAEAMLKLVYGIDAEEVATRFATTCPLTDKEGEHSEYGAFRINYAIGPANMNIIGVIYRWYNESVYYNYNQPTLFCKKQVCHHYVKIIQHNVNKVGCAFVICHKHLKKYSVLACAYPKTLELQENKPYLKGFYCTKCPEDMQECEEGLCAKNHKDIYTYKEIVDESELFRYLGTSEIKNTLPTTCFIALFSLIYQYI